MTLIFFVLTALLIKEYWFCSGRLESDIRHAKQSDGQIKKENKDLEVKSNSTSTTESSEDGKLYFVFKIICLTFMGRYIIQ